MKKIIIIAILFLNAACAEEVKVAENSNLSAGGSQNAQNTALDKEKEELIKEQERVKKELEELQKKVDEAKPELENLNKQIDKTKKDIEETKKKIDAQK